MAEPRHISEILKEIMQQAGDKCELCHSLPDWLQPKNAGQGIIQADGRCNTCKSRRTGTSAFTITRNRK